VPVEELDRDRTDEGQAEEGQGKAEGDRASFGHLLDPAFDQGRSPRPGLEVTRAHPSLFLALYRQTFGDWSWLTCSCSR
jgi:hypothetical protein